MRRAAAVVLPAILPAVVLVWAFLVMASGVMADASAAFVMARP